MENILDRGFDLSERNILEELYELVEKHKLSSNSDFKLGDFYDILSEFDLAFQKFNSLNNDITNAIVNDSLKSSLSIFIAFFKLQGFSDRPFFYAFKRFLEWFTLVLEKSYGLQARFFFERNFSQNFPSLWNNKIVHELFTHDYAGGEILVKNYNFFKERFENAEHNISVEFGIITDRYRDKPVRKLLIFGNDFEVTELDISETTGRLKEIGHYYEMLLDIYIEDDDNDGSKLLQNLNLIVASIASIDNVKVEIDDIKVGSLVARIRVYIQDLVGKEEVKAVLETSKEAVGKALTGGQVSHSEVNKTVAETKKIKVEQKLLEKELGSKPSDFEAKMAHALELEKKALENEQLRNQIKREKLEIIEKLSDLAKKGILEADTVRIEINEVLYIIKEERQPIQLPDARIDDIT